MKRGELRVRGSLMLLWSVWMDSPLVVPWSERSLCLRNIAALNMAFLVSDVFSILN